MLGLRFDTISLTLGTTFSFFVPIEDMPDEPNSRGYNLFEDINVTPSGNTFLYEKGEQYEMDLSWVDIHTPTKEAIEKCVYGWHRMKQITIVSYGSSVNGTITSLGSLASVGQVYGTGYMRFSAMPQESSVDLWKFDTVWKTFGSNQFF